MACQVKKIYQFLAGLRGAGGGELAGACSKLPGQGQRPTRAQRLQNASSSLEFGRRAKFIRHKIKVDKEAIQKQVTDLQRRHGKMSDPDKSEANDMLLGHFVQLNPSGEVIGSRGTRLSVAVGKGMPDAACARESHGGPPQARA